MTPYKATVASETLEGMFLVNNSPNTQHRAPKPFPFRPPSGSKME